MRSSTEVVTIYIELKNIKRDSFGRVEAPTMLLKSHSGRMFGSLGHYMNLKMELKYTDISTITFDYPAYIDGTKAPFYDDLIGDRLIQIDPYGIFILRNPEIKGDGISERKSCQCYSLEYELSNKKITLESGTFKFYNPINPGDLHTLLGRVLEKVKNWRIGSVDSNLWTRYRTFDETEVGLHSFLIDTVQKTYNCVFSFNSYTRTIDVLDADKETAVLPVYLSYDNLIKESTVTEVDDNLFTKIGVYGSEDLSIRDVNPIGSAYLYNLDYYIGTGDIPSPLAGKWKDWQTEIRAQQPYYSSLVMLRTSVNGRYLAEKATLTDLKADLDSLDNIRSTTVQGLQMATIKGPASQTGTKEYFEKRLTEIADQSTAKQREISAQENLLDSILAEYERYNNTIKSIVDRLKIESYFTTEELKTLDHYLSEDAFVDNTFATFDVDITKSEDGFSRLNSATVTLSDITLVDVPMHNSATNHRIYDIDGGTIKVNGTYTKQNADGTSSVLSYTLNSDIVHATLDHKNNGETVFSLYLSSGTANGSSFPSGNLTISCNSSFSDASFLGNLKRVVHTITGETGVTYEDVYYTGKTSFAAGVGSVYFTRNVTEYQRYSVAQALYDYAEKCLVDISCPTYSFELSTANIVYAKEFESFKNVLRLGSACYLQLNDDLMTRQMLLELHMYFEDPSNFSMIFSNEFKRPDKINTLKKVIEEAHSVDRTLNLEKYIYGGWNSSGTKSALDQFFTDGLNAAYKQLQAGLNNSVSMGGFGIKITSTDTGEYIHINNGMIALVDPAGKTTRMAMGHFKTDSGLDFYGILADVIAGKLLAGKNLLIECESLYGGVTQFKVDTSGVFINNGRMYLQSDKGGRIGIDPNYGFFAGTSSLFTVSNTGAVHPSFIDSNGRVKLDNTGFPVNANVWIGIDGQAYFRGNIYAVDGVFNGKVYATDGVFTGTVYGKAGKFEGIVQASKFLDSSGNNMMNSLGQWNPDYLNLKGLNINNKFMIDSNGNVTINGGTIRWGTIDQSGPIEDSIVDAHDVASSAKTKATNAQNDIDDIVSGRYIGGTFIDGHHIESPVISGGLIEGGEIRADASITYSGSGVSEFGVYGRGGHGDKYGYIRYDDGGSGTADEARERMYICTVNGRALKIYSAGNMSIEANGTIYFTSPVHFGSSVKFSEPPENLS